MKGEHMEQTKLGRMRSVNNRCVQCKGRSGVVAS